MFEWCSISVMSTRSPGPTLVRPHEYATRLIASVTFFVKTTSSNSAFSRAATVRRASSKAAVASCERE